MKQREFKTGDTVYDNTDQGKGVVSVHSNESTYCILVDFICGTAHTYTASGKIHQGAPITLSHTDYHFDINQKKPEPVYEKGQEVYMSDDKVIWYFGRYIKLDKDGGAYPHHVTSIHGVDMEGQTGNVYSHVSIEKPF